jgi:8-oxo-dGTP diphosphatase
VTIFLVRHAHAGKRSEWPGDDEERPISARGEAQSSSIGDLLVAGGVRRIVSSPYVRCVQTVQPAAKGLGLDVEPDERLAEGADVDDAMDLLLSLARDDGAACSHGDMIPLLLEQLVAQGMEVEGPLLHQKGSLWTIQMTDGRPVRGRYTPPSA